MKRISIDASDVAILINRDISTAQKLIRTIKDSLNKKRHQRVTIREFCEYEGFSYDEVFELVNGKPN